MSQEKDPVAELRGRIRELRTLVGAPSYKDLQTHAALMGRNLPVSTTADLLTGTAMPRWKTVETFVLACREQARKHRIRCDDAHFDLSAWRALYQSSPLRPRDPKTVPQQLPAEPRLFTGRVSELQRLDSVLDAQSEGRAMVISSIGGMGGVGKSWLALRWAYQHRDRFPDGQLYLNLLGFGIDPPLSRASATRSLLSALGVDPSGIPSDLESQTGLYRSLMCDRRMLVLLDNAHDSAQVAPLLPGSSTCTVLVTSRHSLPGLITHHGAQLVSLSPLTPEESTELLARHIGEARAAAEPAAIAELVEFCAGLPLALGIVAARATVSPNLSLAVICEELHDSALRLDGLDAGELDVNLRVVLSWSYRALKGDAARLFRLLGAVPGPDIGRRTVSNLLGGDQSGTMEALLQLQNTYLVEQYLPRRYRMHDLLRIYSAECAAADEPRADREAAVSRVADFYAQTARTADKLLAPSDWTPPSSDTDTVPFPLDIEDVGEALAWFDAEHPCLTSMHDFVARSGRDAYVVLLARALVNYRYRRGHLHEQVAGWRLAAAAAERLGDDQSTAMSCRALGHALVRAGATEEGLEYLRHVLPLAEQIGDVRGQMITHRILAVACSAQGDDRQALTHATMAWKLCQGLDEPAQEAHALNAVGWYHLRNGDYPQARLRCDQALAIHRSTGDRSGEANTLDSLAHLAEREERYDAAVDLYQQSLAIREQLGNVFGRATALAALGEVFLKLGHVSDAKAAWEEAVRLFSSQFRLAEAERLEARISAVNDVATEPDRV